MSRLKIAALDDRYEVFVGWDTPLSTFFAQVFDLQGTEAEQDEEGDNIVLWLGDEVGEVPTVQALQEGLAAYATIPADVVSELEREQAAAGDPSPLQQQVRSLFTPFGEMN